MSEDFAVNSYVLAEHSYLPSCKSASEFPLYLWVVLNFIDLQDLVLNLLGVAYVVAISMTLPAYWHYGNITANMQCPLIRGA